MPKARTEIHYNTRDEAFEALRARCPLWVDKLCVRHDHFCACYMHASVNYPNPLPPTEATSMNYSTAVFLINRHVRCVMATYEADVDGHKVKATPFKTLDVSIKIGDLAVVPTDTRHGMTVVKVVDVDVDVDFDNSHQMQWIIDVVNTKDHVAIIGQEAEAIKVVKASEMREKRKKIADALLANAKDDFKVLKIADMNGDGKK
jgi:hypothetical protein